MKGIVRPYLRRRVWLCQTEKRQVHKNTGWVRDGKMTTAKVLTRPERSEVELAQGNHCQPVRNLSAYSRGSFSVIFASSTRSSHWIMHMLAWGWLTDHHMRSH